MASKFFTHTINISLRIISKFLFVTLHRQFRSSHTAKNNAETNLKRMKKVQLAAMIGSLFIGSALSAQTSHTGMRGITALAATADMAPGVNLWNTLDAYCGPTQGLESETCWGQPKTTPAIIKTIKDRGFKTLRLPVTWYNHTGAAPDYTIDPVWMDRVEAVANYAFDNGMYVIINLHHEDYDATKPGTWLCPTYAKQAECTERIEKLWKQIATRFKDYGDYLLFETMNEPRQVGAKDEWNGGNAEHRAVVNAYNLAAVNAIRSIGGNNTTRFIMVPQVTATPSAAISDLVIPNADTNIIVSVHNYNPFSFCLEKPGVKTWGSPAEISTLQNELKAISDHFVKNGQAVIVGEWGADNKSNYAERVTYYDVFARACKAGGLTPISWIYSINRLSLKWDSPLLEDAILNVYKSDNVPAENLTLNKVRDTLYVGDTVRLAATVAPVNASSQTAIWISYTATVATVSATGLVTAKASGTSKVTATVIGKTASCTIVVLEKPVSDCEQSATGASVVYPNPVHDKLTVLLSGAPTMISVFDAEGAQIMQLNTNELQVQIDVEGYKPGNYLLKIISSENSETKRFMVE